MAKKNSAQNGATHRKARLIFDSSVSQRTSRTPRRAKPDEIKAPAGRKAKHEGDPKKRQTRISSSSAGTRDTPTEHSAASTDLQNNQAITRAFIAQAVDFLVHQYLPKIEHCLAELNQQLWWRPTRLPTASGIWCCTSVAMPGSGSLRAWAELRTLALATLSFLKPRRIPRNDC
jgi:hypothetical protein